jgi:8-oxo-dGTP diphosphatase
MGYCPNCGTLLQDVEHDGVVRPTCPSCEFIEYKNPKVAVAVLAGMDGKVLLGRRNHQPGMGLWTFPSGYVDAGEVVETAAIRETLEETGVSVRLERLMAVRSHPGNPVVLIVFAGTIVGGEPCAGPECTEVALFPLDKLPELAFPHDEDLIRAWATGETPALQ